MLPPTKSLSQKKNTTSAATPTMATTAASNTSVADTDDTVSSAWNELLQKITASVLVKIEAHSREFHGPTLSLQQLPGIDVLHVKNSLLLSYLIELTVWHQRQCQLHQLLVRSAKSTSMNEKVDEDEDDHEPMDDNDDEDDSEELRSLKTVLQAQWKRLTEMRIALDKLRVLEKSLRYQIDKLLAYQHSGSNTAATVEFNHGNAKQESIDPLQFRPEHALREDGDDEDDDEDGDEEDVDDEDLDDDDDLAMAQRTLKRSATAASNEKSQTTKANKKSTNKEEDDDTNNDNGIYRAPRLSATPYPHDKSGGHGDEFDVDMDDANRHDIDARLERRHRQDERERLRLQRKMQLSEVADTLRHQYSDAPERDDTQGGAMSSTRASASGSASATTVAAKQWQLRQHERTTFEEEHMIRLSISRDEKKERKRLQRQEQSNLHAMTDLGNLARDVQHRQTALTVSRRRDASSIHDDIDEASPKRRFQRMGGADRDVNRGGGGGGGHNSRHKGSPSASARKGGHKQQRRGGR